MKTETTHTQQASFSYVAYESGEYDFFIEDNITGDKVCLTGKEGEMSNEQRAMLSRLFPPCVMTSYDEVINGTN